MAKRRNKGEERRIAGERIERLMELAEQESLAHNPDRSNRYVKMARKLGMRYKVRLHPKHKRRICSHCHHYLMPGVNSTVRISGGKVTVLCRDCGGRDRYPYIAEQRRRGNGAKGAEGA